MGFTFAVKLAIPANTAKKDAVRSKVRVPSRCIVDRVVLHVPPGHQAVVPVWVEANGAQVVPDLDGEGEIRLDSTPDLDLLSVPIPFAQSTELALAGYNEDPANAHTTRVLFIGRYREDLTDEEAHRLGWE